MKRLVFALAAAAPLYSASVSVRNTSRLPDSRRERSSGSSNTNTAAAAPQAASSSR